MAKLIPPTKATRHNTSAGKWSKYHLLAVNSDNRNHLSICGRYMSSDLHPEMYQTESIDQIPAADLCRKCLGAMTAED